MRTTNFVGKVCKKCRKKFVPIQWNQIYCGSKISKAGCSYQMNQLRIRIFNDTKGKSNIRRLQREWMRRQRIENTDYAMRQRKMKREYAKKIDKKEIIKNWRKKNIEKILFWNRRRMLANKGVAGNHTKEEWESLKKYYDYRCVLCSITENDLKEIWKGTGFNKLTKDHIVPLVRGGTDYIWNLQPLCVSCNSKKHKIKNEKIVAVSMGADPVHVGHLRHIQDAKKLGDRLIVILNNDNWLREKKGYVFMPESERAQILMSFRGVDGVIITKHKVGDKDRSVARELEIIKPDIFAKGGDRNLNNLPEPEKEVCLKYNIEIVSGVGGGKIQSSSWLLDKVKAKHPKA